MTTTQDSATDSDLLRAYAADGSDAAFHGLVRRHLGLVHHAALRLLDGDAAAAEDVAQTVFTDLARKAGDLAEHGSLAGWLHTSTRFAAAKVKRSEERRRLREHATMHHASSDDSAPLWDELRPVLDDALHELPGTDREAVLLRFFEKLSLSEVGARLGVGEDAARKRVDRALDRLRDLLAARGVTSATSAAALALLLESRLSAQTTMALQETVARTALGSVCKTAAVTAASGGWLAWFLGWPAKVALVAGLAAVVLSVAAVSRRTDADATAPASRLAAAPAAPDETAANAAAVAVTPAVAPVIDEAASGQPKLLLKLVDAATDRPVAGGEIEFRGWQGEQSIDKTYHSDSNGYCPVYYPAGITDLELTTRIDGLADTRLKWTPKNGEFIPMDYTLRLVKGATIGGVVVDEGGRPVANAKVGFNHNDDPANYKGPESHEFFWIEVTTDTEGRWQNNRIAPEVLWRIRGLARHPDFGPSQYLERERTAAQLPALAAMTHRFVLATGFVVQGKVVDTDGKPVAGAEVLVGLAGITHTREAKSDADGVFSVRGCQAGEAPVSASAKGFAVTSVRTKVGPEMEPVDLVLRPGRVVRLKVVDEQKRPIHRAWTAYSGRGPNPFDNSDGLPQAEFSALSDPEGRIIWSNAPMTDLNFSFAATGKLRRDEIRVSAGADEHEVVLSPALRLRSEVRDAVTGQLIPQFRLSLGWAQMRALGVTNAQFSGIDRFYSDHVGGRFDKFVEETTIGGESPPPCMFKVEAEGYAPFVSRQIGWDEGEVTIPVVMQPVKEALFTVLRPDGSPAADTDVVVVLPQSRFVLKPGGFDVRQSSEAPRRTDAEGRIKLAVEEPAQLVVAAGAEGYGEFAPHDLRPEEPIQLKPWSRVEGQLKGNALAKSWGPTPGGEPVENHVTLQRAGVRPLAEVPFQASYWSFKVKAEPDGRFVLPMVPPGEWAVVPVSQVKTAEGHSASKSGNAQRVTIPAGETVEVVLGGNGSRVVAKAGALPEGVAKDAVIIGFVSTEGSQPPKELWKDLTKVGYWHIQPEIQAMDVKQFPCVLADGQLVAEEVLPGTYTFQIMVMPPARTEAGRPANQPIKGILAIAQHNFTVPDPAPPEGIDLGEIQLEPLGQ